MITWQSDHRPRKNDSASKEDCGTESTNTWFFFGIGGKFRDNTLK
jgi:hypothetical protein